MLTKATAPAVATLAAFLVILAAITSGYQAGDAKKVPLPTTKPHQPSLTKAQEEELLSALKENDLQQYNRLEELRKTSLANYQVAAGYAWQWYQTWKHAPKDVQAAVIQERQAGIEIAKCLRDIRREKDPAQLAKLSEKLLAAVSRQFDAEQKISEYRVAQFENRIKQLREELKGRAKDRTKIINERIEKWKKTPPKEENELPTPTTKPAEK